MYFLRNFWHSSFMLMQQDANSKSIWLVFSELFFNFE
jgi:hypothetical protein